MKMNLEKMSLEELKDYASSIGVSVGNIGKEKLIKKIKTLEEEKSINSLFEDDDIKENIADNNNVEAESYNNSPLLESISAAIEDLEDFSGGEIEDYIEISNDVQIPVKSITFGGLTYKSRTTNAIYRWNQIGAIEYMTIGELNEMNNYNESFLRNPLVILMDERAVRKFRLTSVYENVAKINNLSSVFKSDINTISKVIDDALRVNMRDILISKVRQMYKNKKLVDINVIRLLQDKLQFDIIDDEY